MLNSDDHVAYIFGYDDGNIHPDAALTRAQTAMIFYRLLRNDVRTGVQNASVGFSDVAGSAWYATAVSALAKLGILEGYPDGSFGPGKPVTRAEFASIAARFDKTAAATQASFTDISGHWAAAAISRAAELGWVNGYADGTFGPDRQITRAETAAMINRVLRRNPKSAADLLDGMRVMPDNTDPTKWYYLDLQEATNSHDFARRDDGTEYWTALKN